MNNYCLFHVCDITLPRRQGPCPNCACDDNFYKSSLAFHYFQKMFGSKRVHGNTTHLV